MRHILCRNRTRAHPARARVRCTRQFLRLLAAAERGRGRAERGSPCRRSRSKTPTTLVVPAKAGTQRLGSCALDSRAPLSRGEGRTVKPRAPHAGRARDRAHSGYAPGMARNPNPAALRVPSPKARARLRGCVSLVTFFAQAKKVTRPPGWRTKPHMDVSRLSRSATEQSNRKRRARSKWIPAFAGMTKGGSRLFAGMTDEWIPTFAGMTEEWVPASAGMTKASRQIPASAETTSKMDSTLPPKKRKVRRFWAKTTMFAHTREQRTLAYNTSDA